jgi:predicted acetyltransferase
VTDDIAIEVPTEADWPEFSQMLATAFHEVWEDDSRERSRTIFEPDRSLVARRDGRIVGTASIMTRQLVVPGAIVPAGHVTFVAVAATARRRGVLTRFMRQQFSDMRAAAEPIAVLWASEGRIYQRFGYGLAARKLAFSVDSREVRVTADIGGGQLRDGSVADLRDAIVKVYDEVFAERPGYSERTPVLWDYRLSDPQSERRHATELHALLHTGDSGPDGYALWAGHDRWDDGGPDSEVKIRELVATTPTAYAALWNHLLTMDLTRSANLWCVPVDDPLQYMVNEPRRLGARITDAIWLRVLDVPAALAARRYAAPVDVVIEVSDGIIDANNGRFRLIGSPTAATCTPTTDPADLSCTVGALGAAYLGDASLAQLAGAGTVHESRPGTLAAAATAFGWHRRPGAVEPF